MSERHYRQIRTARAHNIKGTLARTFHYLKAYGIKIWIVLIAIVISSLTGVISSYFFTPIINNYIVPYIGDAHPDTTGFVKMLILMGIVYLLGVISTFTYRKLVSIISTGVLNDLRKELFNKMQVLPIKFFDTHTHGQMMIYYTNDIDTIRPMIAETFPQFLTTMLTLVGTFVMMGILNLKLMLVVAVMLGFMILITYLLGHKSQKYFAALQRQVSDINGFVEEMFSGQKVIKIFNHEEESVDEFTQLDDALYRSSVRTNAFASMLMPINGNLSYLTYALVAVLGAKLCIDGNMSLGALASFLLYVRQFMGPISNLSQQFNGFMMALAGAERAFALMDQPGEVDEGKITMTRVTKDPNGKLVPTDSKSELWAWKIPTETGFELKELKGDVVLDKVNFGYKKDKPILHNISLYAKPGQKIAFVGSTGAGKTTITNLLNRFYEVKDGSVKYDGIEIKEIKKADLRHSIGMVLQDTVLFSGSVMENIRYGNLEASDEECIAAAKRCNADSFIKRLPQGYQTVLSGNGSNLSQGQRQLLNIARCAIADPPVMILDEATSSIDTHTEKLIENGMDELMKGRTTFVIAHRLSTVRNAKAIIVLEHGRIVERGNHDSLLKLKGRYYQLYTGQAELD